jgi:hypothetical protein
MKDQVTKIKIMLTLTSFVGIILIIQPESLFSFNETNNYKP